ncbi:MAG TPA: glucokinase, partial [Polyangiales bacterium]|nr:glucokinase [Polyangiales bacterium]
MRVLAGDVGGTKTELAVYEVGPGAATEAEPVARSVYPSADYDTFGQVLAQFLPSAGGKIDAAAFGVAGPVQDGRCQTTNLPWTLAEREIVEAVGAPVKLINDFHAVALGVLELPDSQLHVLQAAPRDPSG